MRELIIKDQNGKTAYPILIGQDSYQWLAGNTSKYSKIVVLTDEIVWNACSALLEGRLSDFTLIKLAAGEDQKNINSYQQVLQGLSEAHADRSSLLINFGGGVVTDLGGFAASTYMRGIDFVNLPTSLLSQVDASVGGKTGINFNGVKNLVGTFALPKAVLINPESLQGLTARELSSGHAENIKHAAIRSADFFSFLENQDAMNPDWDDLIARSLAIKQAIVENDFKESGLRKLLNFGHTAGHALESLLLKNDKSLTHGEAVALGMIFEAQLAIQEGQLSPEDFVRLKNLIAKFQLPVEMTTTIKWDDFSQKIAQDKKNQGDKINWTNLQSIGSAQFDLHYDEQVVKDVFNKVTQ